MKIESTDITVSRLLSQGWYKIPRFQRPYSWAIEDITEFWQDTVVENKGDYFIGSMVIYEAEDSQYGIVDGQQRLTTITIMLCALRDVLGEYHLDDLANGVHTKIERVNLENKNEFVLKTETSFPYFQGYIQSKDKASVFEQKIEEERNIKTAYVFFVEEIKKKIEWPGISREDAFKNIRDLILNLKVVLITLGSEDDAYLIFEILNARGQNLSPSDLIKNYIFRFIGIDNKDIDMPQQQWKAMVNSIESVQNPVTIDEFLYHYWLSRNDQVTSKELYKAFKRLLNRENATDILSDICVNSKLYAKIIDANLRDWEREEVEIVNSLNSYILFAIKMHLPAVLSLVRAYNQKIVNLRNLKRALKLIEKFHFVFTAICSKRSSGSISKIYSDFSKNLNECKTVEESSAEIDKLRIELIKKVPSYEVFRPSFINLNCRNGFTRQKKIITYILSNFYALKNNGIHPERHTQNIEHICSQASAENEDQSLVIGSIGNLIIIPDKINAMVGSSSFLEKKDVFLENSLVIPDSVKDNTDWTFSDIMSRTERMSEVAYNIIWSL